MTDITREQAIDFLSNLSIVQLIALTKELEMQWGVKAAPPPVVIPDITPPAEVKEEKTEFGVILTAAANKIQTIKVVREITGLGLKEAKEFVESLPKPVKEQCSKEEAEDIKKKLEDAGAVVELQ